MAELLSLGVGSELLSDELDQDVVPRLVIVYKWKHIRAQLPVSVNYFNQFFSLMLLTGKSL